MRWHSLATFSPTKRKQQGRVRVRQRERDSASQPTSDRRINKPDVSKEKMEIKRGSDRWRDGKRERQGQSVVGMG